MRFLSRSVFALIENSLSVNKRGLCVLRNTSANHSNYDYLQHANRLCAQPDPVLLSKRFKHSKKKSQKRDLEDEEEDEEDDVEDVAPGAKIISSKVLSLRLDLIMKTGLGISRNKIDEAFFQGNIRVNGKKPSKKSMMINEGDELDLIQGYNINNVECLNVHRVVLLSYQPVNDGIRVKISKDKSLMIENYPEDPWRP